MNCSLLTIVPAWTGPWNNGTPLLMNTLRMYGEVETMLFLLVISPVALPPRNGKPMVLPRLSETMVSALMDANINAANANREEIRNMLDTEDSRSMSRDEQESMNQ